MLGEVMASHLGAKYLGFALIFGLHLTQKYWKLLINATECKLSHLDFHYFGRKIWVNRVENVTNKILSVWSFFSNCRCELCLSSYIRPQRCLRKRPYTTVLDKRIERKLLTYWCHSHAFAPLQVDHRLSATNWSKSIFEKCHRSKLQRIVNSFISDLSGS